MPRLPTAQDLGGRPTPSVQGGISRLHLETPRQGAEAAALVDFGQAVQGLGNSLAVMAAKQKRDLDEARAEEATSDYLNNLMELEYGEKDGFSNVLSGDAVKRPLVEEYRKRREEIGKRIREGLSSPDQQMAFDKRAQIADRQFDARLYSHVATQSRAYQDIVFEGAKASERRMAALNWSQPGQIELSVLRTSMEVERKARLDGLDPQRPEDRQVIDTLKVIAETQIHADVVDQMILQGKDSAASAYYERIKDRLTPEAIVTLGSKVEASALEGTAIRSADMAWEIFGPKTLDEPVRLDLAESWIRDNYKEDPRVMKSAIADLRSRAAAHNDAQQEVTASNEAKVLDAYHNGADLKALQQMPEYWALDGERRMKTRDYILNNGWSEQQRGRAQLEYAEGEKARASFGAYWELSNPQVLANMSEAQILALEPEMGQALVADLMTMRRKLASPDKVRAANIDSELFNVVAAEAGLDPYKQKKGDDEKEYLGRLKNEVLAAIDIAQQHKKGLLNREEKEEIMRSMVDKKVMVDRGWRGFDSKMPAAAVKPEQRQNVYVPIKEIDPAWLDGAINYMRSVGEVPMNWSNDKAKQAFKGRLERAYGVSVTGGTSVEGKEILEGR